MGRLRKDHVITRGDLWEFTYPIKTEDPCAVKSLTGFTGSMIFTAVGSTTSVLTKAMTIVSASAGTIKISLSTTDTGTTLTAGRFEAYIVLNDSTDDFTIEDTIFVLVREKKA